jgi:hypothetical protein
MNPDLRRYCDWLRERCEREDWPLAWTVYLCRLLRMGGAPGEANGALTAVYDHNKWLFGGPPAWPVPRDVVGIGPPVATQWEAKPTSEPYDPPAPETVRIR